MVLPPRELLVRLVLWGAVFGWAVFKIRDLGSGAVAVPELLSGPPPAAAPAPVRVPLPRPDDLPAATPAAPAPEGELAAAVAARDAALATAATCGLSGELGVAVGPAGIASAWFVEVPSAPPPASPSADGHACAARAAWSAPWPALPTLVEFSGALSRSAP